MNKNKLFKIILIVFLIYSLRSFIFNIKENFSKTDCKSYNDNKKNCLNNGCSWDKGKCTKSLIGSNIKDFGQISGQVFDEKKNVIKDFSFEIKKIYKKIKNVNKNLKFQLENKLMEFDKKLKHYDEIYGKNKKINELLKKTTSNIYKVDIKDDINYVMNFKNYILNIKNDGTYTIKLPEGNYIIYVKSENCIDKHFSVNIKSRNNLTHDFFMKIDDTLIDLNYCNTLNEKSCKLESKYCDWIVKDNNCKEKQEEYGEISGTIYDYDDLTKIKKFFVNIHGIIDNEKGIIKFKTKHFENDKGEFKIKLPNGKYTLSIGSKGYANNFNAELFYKKLCINGRISTDILPETLQIEDIFIPNSKTKIYKEIFLCKKKEFISKLYDKPSKTILNPSSFLNSNHENKIISDYGQILGTVYEKKNNKKKYKYFDIKVYKFENLDEFDYQPNINPFYNFIKNINLDGTFVLKLPKGNYLIDIIPSLNIENYKQYTLEYGQKHFLEFNLNLNKQSKIFNIINSETKIFHNFYNEIINDEIFNHNALSHKLTKLEYNRYLNLFDFSYKSALILELTIKKSFEHRNIKTKKEEMMSKILDPKIVIYPKYNRRVNRKIKINPFISKLEEAASGVVFDKYRIFLPPIESDYLIETFISKGNSTDNDGIDRSFIFNTKSFDLSISKDDINKLNDPLGNLNKKVFTKIVKIDKKPPAYINFIIKDKKDKIIDNKYFSIVLVNPNNELDYMKVEQSTEHLKSILSNESINYKDLVDFKYNILNNWSKNVFEVPPGKWKIMIIVDHTNSNEDYIPFYYTEKNIKNADFSSADIINVSSKKIYDLEILLKKKKKYDRGVIYLEFKDQFDKNFIPDKLNFRHVNYFNKNNFDLKFLFEHIDYEVNFANYTNNQMNTKRIDKGNFELKIPVGNYELKMEPLRNNYFSSYYSEGMSSVEMKKKFKCLFNLFSNDNGLKNNKSYVEYIAENSYLNYDIRNFLKISKNKKNTKVKFYSISLPKSFHLKWDKKGFIKSSIINLNDYHLAKLILKYYNAEENYLNMMRDSINNFLTNIGKKGINFSVRFKNIKNLLNHRAKCQQIITGDNYKRGGEHLTLDEWHGFEHLTLGEWEVLKDIFDDTIIINNEVAENQLSNSKKIRKEKLKLANYNSCNKFKDFNEIIEKEKELAKKKSNEEKYDFLKKNIEFYQQVEKKQCGLEGKILDEIENTCKSLNKLKCQEETIYCNWNEKKNNCEYKNLDNMCEIYNKDPSTFNPFISFDDKVCFTKECSDIYCDQTCNRSSNCKFVELDKTFSSCIKKPCYHKSNSKNDCENDNNCVWDGDINECLEKNCNINMNESTCNKKTHCKWDSSGCVYKFCDEYNNSINEKIYCKSGGDPECKWDETFCRSKYCRERKWLNSAETCSLDEKCKWDGKACRERKCVEYELGKKNCEENNDCMDYNNKDLEWMCNKEKKNEN